MSMDPALKEILTEMCSRVGADVESIDFSEPLWFHKHQWTQHQEAEFVDWLAARLYDCASYRKLFTYCRRTRKDCRKSATHFVWNYGWKLKEHA